MFKIIRLLIFINSSQNLCHIQTVFIFFIIIYIVDAAAKQKSNKSENSGKKAKSGISKSKKKPVKRKREEKLEVLFEPLPKRMASLNAQVNF